MHVTHTNYVFPTASSNQIYFLQEIRCPFWLAVTKSHDNPEKHFFWKQLQKIDLHDSITDQ